MKKLMTNEDYHKEKAIGSTLLKSIASKSLFGAINTEFKESEAMLLGSAFHSLILEPENFHREYAFAPKVDKRTKEGKATWASFVESSEGMTVLKDEMRDILMPMKDEFLAHKYARNILSGGESEFSYFVKDEETGLDLKCRPDIFNKGSLIDVKTTRDASPDGFASEISKYNYHMQAAFYIDVFQAASGQKVDKFIFVAIEAKAPFMIGVYTLDEVSISFGRKLYKKMLAEYKSFLESGDELNQTLHGYTNGIVEISIPTWKLQKDEDRIEMGA